MIIFQGSSYVSMRALLLALVNNQLADPRSPKHEKLAALRQFRVFNGSLDPLTVFTLARAGRETDIGLSLT